MEKIVIIGEYPNEKNIKDGMIRRIKQIDNELIRVERIYLNIKFGKNLEKTVEVFDNVTIYNINFFKNFNIIKKILKENKILYVHSLLNFSKIFLFLKRDNDIILDTHGAVVEEMYFYNKNIKGKILKKLEKYLFLRLKKVIFVNNSMKQYYEKKYSNLIKKETLIYPIIELKSENLIEKIETPEELKNNSKINIVYSGNLQKWQNIDLMLKKLKEIENDDYNYIFLTGQIFELQKKLEEYKIKNYILKSVLPEELKNYYYYCDYGLLLRDEHILNKVANPTKLSEYMEYGMIPIVKYEDIGDYLSYGYEHLKINNLDKNLKKIKSKKNTEIIKKIKNETQKIDFQKFIWE